MDVVDKAVELLAGSPFDVLKVTKEQAATVLRKEKAERAFPTIYRPGPDYSDLLEAAVPCDCPDCRRARGEDSGAIDDFGEEDDDFDIESLLESMPLPPGMPPKIGKMMIAEALGGIARGESVDSVMSRLFGSRPGSGGKNKKGRRA
jgi:hypothetical protein